MSDKSLPQAGVGIGTTATTTLIGVLSGCTGLLPEEYRETWKQLIPYISPFISWAGIWVYNRFVEPPEMASIKGKLKRDIRYLKKCLKDKYMSEEAKADVRRDYEETQKQLARLGRDYSSGVFSPTPTSAPTATPPANPQ
ncbi:hypothetical protein SR86_12445 [Enterobacter hormaechei subsp. xiangfangensis]|uniref:hypothetical protein n=1 Tax=Enterobacter hormaechei TaxID=158836 RepID=UPI0005EE5DBB|nr:hypothetical protein [Enterobacter hormaechei]KJO32782.1 hypothetical protein SS01_08265 [Enterobacter hormaechei subsp. xiangfangensis]KJO88009.1 hypothetical protein SR86_12445 [Enterobacter hormaechei subsp. xiangfangensis]KJP01928.1 hypothetical protein SR95_12515 [Enterobacter hormaechei subsp. xiangfangensis]